MNDIIKIDEGSLSGTYGEHGVTLSQDLNPFLEKAKVERNISDERVNMGYGSFRKVATIPDVIALEMLIKHGVDIHDESINDDRNQMKRAMDIINRDYKNLMSVSVL